MFDSRLPKEIQRKIFELTLALYRVTDFFPPGEAIRKQLREKANEVFGITTEYGYSAVGEDITAVAAKIEVIKGYLGIVRSLRFVRPVNLSILEREYDLLARFFIEETGAVKRTERDDQKQSAQTPDLVSPPKKIEERQEGKRQEEEVLSTWADFAVAEVSKSSPKGKIEIWQGEDAGKASGEGDAGLLPIVRDLNDRQKKIIEQLKTTPQAKISDFFTAFDDISSKTIQRDLQDLVSRNILKKEGEKRWTTYSFKDVR